MTATAPRELQDMRTIHALALAVDDKDHYTRNHSERVALYATAVAVHIGLPDRAHRADRDRGHLARRRQARRSRLSAR